jgi:hypothetical protein
MDSKSSENDDSDERDVLLHREMDRLIEMWDNSPSHEKWHRGARWR